MQKIGTMRAGGSGIFKGRQLTIGLDLGDRSSYYCVLDEAGEVVLEDSLAGEAFYDFAFCFLPRLPLFPAQRRNAFSLPLSCSCFSMS
jgi:hypothetical protein